MPNSCKTYSATWDDDGTPIFENLKPNEIFEKIPAGSKLISGTIFKTKYKRGCRTFTVFEDIQT